MKFDVLTLFPEVILPYLESSMLKRAADRGLVHFQCHQIRDHAIDAYGHVDDVLYGGGSGMLLMAEPVYQSWQDAVSSSAEIQRDKRRTLFLSPKGRPLNQALVREYAGYEQLILICGHYEGLDQRVLDEIVDEEVSLGDFVLTGGELAALAVIDSVSRMLDGVLPNQSAYEAESHFHGLLENRQYTRPPEWKGRSVPEVLREGHHEKIESFRQLDGLNETLLKRPDLFDSAPLDSKQILELLRYRKTLAE